MIIYNEGEKKFNRVNNRGKTPGGLPYFSKEGEPSSIVLEMDGWRLAAEEDFRGEALNVSGLLAEYGIPDDSASYWRPRDSAIVVDEDRTFTYPGREDVPYSDLFPDWYEEEEVDKFDPLCWNAPEKKYEGSAMAPGFYDNIIKLARGKKMDFIIENKEMDYETIKTYNKDNLVKGREQVEEQRANKEAQEAAEYYTELIDYKEQIERSIAASKVSLKEVNTKLKIFGGK